MRIDSHSDAFLMENQFKWVYNPLCELYVFCEINAHAREINAAQQQEQEPRRWP